MQTKLYETLVDKHREEILAAEDYIGDGLPRVEDDRVYAGRV